MSNDLDMQRFDCLTQLILQLVRRPAVWTHLPSEMGHTVDAACLTVTSASAAEPSIYSDKKIKDSICS